MVLQSKDFQSALSQEQLQAPNSEIKLKVTKTKYFFIENPEKKKKKIEFTSIPASQPQ